MFSIYTSVLIIIIMLYNFKLLFGKMTHLLKGMHTEFFWCFFMWLAVHKIHCGDDFEVHDPTIHPLNNLNYSALATSLRHAMEGYGTNENKIINILTTTSLNQRRKVSEKYSELFKKNVTTDLKKELSGSFQKLMLALLQDPANLLAEGLYNAMKGWGTDEDTLSVDGWIIKIRSAVQASKSTNRVQFTNTQEKYISYPLTEILCCHNGADINKISEAFKTTYRKDLQDEVHSETSGNYRDLLIHILTKSRSSDGVNKELSKKIAQAFIRTGYGKNGKMNEAVVIEQLTTHSFAQIADALKIFHEIIGQDFRESIKHGFSGDFGTAVLKIVDCAENRPRAYAMRLKETMGRFRTDEKALIRIIVLRSAIDLNTIRTEYLKLYDETLENRIRKSTNADFRRGLTALLTGEQPKAIK